jgi:hypothetical protein
MGRSRSASTVATSETHQKVILRFKKNSIQEQRKEKKRKALLNLSSKAWC